MIELQYRGNLITAPEGETSLVYVFCENRNATLMYRLSSSGPFVKCRIHGGETVVFGRTEVQLVPEEINDGPVECIELIIDDRTIILPVLDNHHTDIGLTLLKSSILMVSATVLNLDSNVVNDYCREEICPPFQVRIRPLSNVRPHSDFISCRKL